MLDAQWSLGLSQNGAGRSFPIEYISASYLQFVNEPAVLKVVGTEIRAGDEINPDFPDAIFILDRNRSVVDLCRIVELAVERDENGAISGSVEAHSLLADLGRVDAAGYEADKGVQAIVSDLLGLQTGTLYPQITSGTIAPNATVQIEAGDNDSVLSVLRKLRQIVGGIITVDHEYNLHWAHESSVFAGKRIRQSMNARGIRWRKGFRAIRTSVQITGKNGIEASASNTTEYGPTIPYRKAFPAINGQSTLQAVANELLESVRKPQQEVDVDFLDLAEAKTNFDHERVSVGELVNVRFEPISVERLFRIYSIQRHLDDPLNARLTFGDPDRLVQDRPPDFIDTLADIVAEPPLPDAVTIEDLPDPYDETPEPVGDEVTEGDPGESPAFARGDHQHPFQPATWEGGVVSDMRGVLGVDDIETAIESIPDLSDDTPELIVAPGSGSAGTEDVAARADHKHEWFVQDFTHVPRQYRGANLNNLNEINDVEFRDGDMAVTSGDDQMWVWSDDAWRPTLRFPAS
jgi:hypothetical protein